MDALCINQEQKEERQQQVGSMAKIYNNAQHAAIWLGDGDEESDRAMKFMGKIVQLPVLDRALKEQSNCEDWRALKNLMMRTWYVLCINP